MTSKERMRATLARRTPDRIPIDFGGTAVTGIHVSCVAALRDHFGLPKQPVKVHEPYQMLGWVEEDLKQAMGLDVDGVVPPRTMFGYANSEWKEWRTPQGLEVLVAKDFVTTTDANGDILIYPEGDASVPPSGRMPASGYFFDSIVRQEPIDDDHLNLEDNLQDTEKFWSKLRLDMAEMKQTDLPDGVLGPVVDYDFGDTVAVLLAIHSDHYGYRELKDYAERIESVIRRIRAVSKVKRIGEQKEEIDVSSTLSRLSQYSVSAEQVMKALEGRNMVHYAGAVPTQRGKPPIQATGAFETEDQIRHVMIDVSRAGQPVYIGDLANVDRVYKDPTQYARSRGERAIMLSVEMQEGNNIVEFGKEVHASLDSLRPLLPPDLKIEFVADQPTVVADRVKHFIREFAIAIASVILVTMLLLPFRVALVSAVAIPVTICATFGLLNAFGIELHQVSIAALIVVLGMVVDDAIVIADNFIELLDHGLPRPEAAWRSASELAVPVLTATLTIICSFLPFLILSGATANSFARCP